MEKRSSDIYETAATYSVQGLGSIMHSRIFAGVIAFAILCSIVLNACTPQKNLLEQVLAAGELRALTRNAATTFYEGPHGPTGMEYDLLQRFATYLNVKLTLTTSDDLKDILEQVEGGDAHVAAAGLTITDARKQKVLFAPSYQSITQQLIYNRKNQHPRNLADLQAGKMEVIANSSHVERLTEIKQTWKNLSWEENSTAGANELMNLVAQKTIDFTIADSNAFSISRRYYPQLSAAFDISEPQQLAWAFSNSDDRSLYNKAVTFFNNLKTSGELDSLIERHYGHINRYDYAGTYTYMYHVNNRLPKYQVMLSDAATANNIDWRLLAATAYQESHWNPRAKSPTGVRGIMMLTKVTAAQLGVLVRTDPEESINGGAKYLRSLLNRLPADMEEPDRTWLALASYNVGYGHVKDAQLITEQRGDNPYKWEDVKKSLPLLRQKKWYKNTRYGYARGLEPVRYVENIRSYYDILRWQLDKGLNNDVPESILAFSSPVL